MNWKKICAFVLSMLLFVSAVAAGAEETVVIEDDIELKIGIYYGSSAKESVALIAAEGFAYFSETDDGVQTPLLTDVTASVEAARNTGYNIRITADYADLAAAQADAANVAGAAAAYINGQPCLLVSGFSDAAQAQTALDVLTLGERKAQITEPDASCVLVKKDGIVFFAYSMQGEFLALRPINEQTVTIGERVYRGGVMIKRASNSDMTVINLIRMEPYLASVLGAETYSGWPMEALKAQAIASKGFALTNINKYKKSYGFNLDTTTNSQVYLGVVEEHERFWQAVRETMGVVAIYDGAPAATYFFASSGGRTADASVVWGGKTIPYLTGVSDPYEQDVSGSRHTWQKAFTFEELRQKLSDRGVNVGDIISITLTERTPNGRAGTLLIIGTENQTEISGTGARSIFGLYSTNFTLYTQEGLSGLDKVEFTDEIPLPTPETPAVPETPEVTDNVSVLTADGIVSMPLDGAIAVTKNIAGILHGSVSVLTKDGVETLPSGGTAQEEQADQDTAEPEETTETQENTQDTQTTEPVQGSVVVPEFEGDILFDGGGYGHGVGMSQWGSKFMAEAGFTYQQILQHYMPGIEFAVKPEASAEEATQTETTTETEATTETEGTEETA